MQTQRGTISRRRLAIEAIGLIDQNGLRGLSMRKLGAAVGIEAMSLYHYVDSKDDLLDAVMGELYAQIEIPSLGADASEWEDCVRRGLCSFRAVLVEHPAAIVLFPTRPAPVPEGINTLRQGFDLLRGAGLESRDAVAALHFAISFVLGHMTDTVRLDAFPAARQVDAADNQCGTRDYDLAREAFSADELFDAGLDLVIASLRSQFRLP